MIICASVFLSTNNLKLLKFEPCPLVFVLLPSESSFMASDSQTATATMSEKPLETKVNEEAKLMEKEIVLSETVDVVKDKPVSESNLTIEKEEKTVQTPAGEPEKEIPADVEEAAEVVKADESNDKGKDENGEEKVAEQVGLEEPTLVKEVVAMVNVQADDVEKAEEGKGKDENGEEKVAEQVELKEPTLVKESVDGEKAEEKQAVESVAEEDNKDKEEEEKKMVDVSESKNEAGGKQVEPIDVQLVKEVSVETVDVEVLEVEPKPETSEKAEAQPEKAKELAPEVEVVKTPETTEEAKVELEDSIVVETKDSGINSKDEHTSESGTALLPEETVPINQDLDTAPIKETEGDASSPPDVTEKTTTEEKQVVEEPSKDEKEKVSEEAKATEDENIKKDTETPAADVESVETLKETEGTKQEESVTEKVAEVVETATVAKESDEPKPQPEVTTKEEVVKPKHTNSIMSKVKQSLVKAKKAIIGKSPSSKTISTEETKEEVIAK
ncbi:A-kinase anchor protein 12-like isoform X1 [Brassica napus]|nr:PREDICTED: A-kinase anchor protein 12-like [Brassica oleracea var. oleracea]XP_013684476.2 A-kinase anchor protein 12-like isoform X1 [Brassica napus]